MTTRTVSVALKLLVSDFVANGGKAVTTAKHIGGSLKSLSDPANKAKLADISKVALGVGGALLAVAGYAVKAAYAFDKQMSEVQAVSGATKAQLGQLRDAAIEAGKETMFSATDAAKAEAELAKAGIGTADILGGALKGSLSLAAAGQMDLADAATISAQAMNVFQLHGKDVGHIADVLASAANASAADMSDLGMALKQGGLVAQQTGLHLEDTVGVLAAFADRALVGSDAGTSLKTMLQALNTTEPKTVALMKQLGISAYDAQGNFIGIDKVAQNLQDSLGGLTTAQRNAAMAQIFGSDATRSASILYQLGAAGVDKYTAEVNHNGAAAQTAAQKMNNLSGDVEQLKGSLETLAITSSGGVTKGLRFLAQGMTDLVNIVISLPPPLGEAITIISGLGGAGITATVGLLKLKSVLNDASDAIKGIQGGEKAIGVIKNLAKSGGEIGLVAAGVGLFAVGIGKLLVHNNEWKPAAANIDELTLSLKRLAETGKVSGYMATVYGKNLATLAKDLTYLKLPNLVDPTGSNIAIANINETLDKMRATGLQGVADLNKGLEGLVTSGNLSAANLAFQDITDSLVKQGIPLSQVNQLFDGYFRAADKAAIGSTNVAQGVASASQKLGILNEGLAKAISLGETLDTVFKELNGANIDAAQADIAFQQSLDDIAKTLGANIKSLHGAKNALDDHSQAGRDDMSVILQGIKNAEAAAQATYNQTQSVDAASKAYDDHIAALRRTLTQAGLTKAQIDALLKDFAQMPPAVAVPITAPGAGTVLGALTGIYDVIRKLPGGKTFTLHVDEVHTGGAGPISKRTINRWGGAYEHAAEGVLRDASVYSAKSPARYAFAEPATKGELFAPKEGNLARTRSMVDYAVSNWWGGKVSWGAERYGRTASTLGAGAAFGRPAPVAAVAASPTVIVKLIDPQTGKVTRQAMIDDARGRGVPQPTIKAAYP